MRRYVIAFVCILMVSVGWTAARAADPIGAAAKVEDTLTGPAGQLLTGASVYFNDKLKTDATGVGQIVFKDDTKLAIGPNAEVTIDKFVYNDDGSFKELAVGLTKGTFRWISGKSKPEAYKISTGWANLAIRGTAFDVNVDPAGSLTLVLYEGEVTVCLATGDCRTVAGRCQYIVSETRIDIRDPQALPRSRALELKGTGLIPFIDNAQLIKPFHVKNASCKVRKAQRQRKAQKTLRTKRAQRATRTKTAALSVKPTKVAALKSITAAKAKGRVASKPDPTPSSTPDPTPSALPDPIDSPTPTAEGPTAVDSGKKGRRGRTGNPGNNKGKGKAGENPGGGDFGGGTKGKGDTHGKGGKGGKGGGGKGGKK